MTKRKSKRWGKHTDEQIRAEISNKFETAPAFENMNPVVMCILFTLGVAILAASVALVHPWEGGWYAALAFVGLSLLWTLYVLLRRKTLTAKQFTELPVEMRKRYLRVKTMWFHFYMGVYLTLISALIMLFILGTLGLLGEVGIATGLIVGYHFLLFIGSFLLRRVLLRISVEGFPETWWGKIMVFIIGLAMVFGSLPAGAGVLAAKFLPWNIVALLATTIFFTIVTIIIPRAVYDIVAGHIQLQAIRADMERTGAMPFERL